MKTVDQITTEAKAVIQTADVAVENFADEVRSNALTALLASEGAFVAATDQAVWMKVLDFLATPEVVFWPRGTRFGPGHTIPRPPPRRATSTWVMWWGCLSC